MECTCFIEYYEGFKDKPDRIIYCPLHKSAPDLYKACRNVYEAHWQGLPQLLESVIETMVKPAIAKAELTPKPPNSHK